MHCNVCRTISLPLCLLAITCFGDLSRAGHPVPNFVPKFQEQVIPPGAKMQLLWDEGEFTEGPAPMAGGDILFSDIGNRIMRFDPKTQEAGVFREPSGKANGLMYDSKGQLIACEGAGPGGERRISITGIDRKVRTLADSYEGKRFNSPNDLAITKTGNVYFTDPRYVGSEPRELAFEAVFLVEPSGKVKVATRDVEKPNGILVAPNQRTVYVADHNSDPTGAHTLLAFDIGPNGALGNKRVLFDFGAHKRGIDGMTLDQRGNIYSAAGAGDEAGIYVFSSTGIPLAFISTPGDPTNCVFGVGTEAKRLYVTAASPSSSGGDAKKYGLYCCDLAIPGYHVYPQVMP